MNTTHLALLVVGAVLLAFSVYLLYGALYMVGVMGRYGCMGMMCGPMMYYPLFLPLSLLTIGIALIVMPAVLGRQVATDHGVSVNASPKPSDGVNQVLKLLPRQEREVLDYIIKNGGEVYQYMITRDLGLNKVRVWRIIKRLEEKGLVEVTKVKGRNLVRVKMDELRKNH
ncbi:helix-turn-helix transcriptional regulator [Vulcanisaeta thermophila]|uniref:helix-turn-helix transcriptional regulator n=1 Tax=Vulcanisaeta thermophila TaxID=867917 RepID=UPI000852E5A7|nr:MarR family transcriptional regulator [Vulcanisaeta thermophila]